MAEDPLARLVQRAMTDPDFVRRGQADLEGTLAAEGIRLGPEEMAAVRSFQAEVAGLSPSDVAARLSVASQEQGIC
jgi:hypothetical protein